MPRIPPKLLANASKYHPLLPLLLPPTARSLESAKSELRWIMDAVPATQLKQACHLRSHHVPLQYILGSQPFNMLDILCKPGVLIPRWETEEWASRLATLISSNLTTSSPIKQSRPKIILDLCTGTGCIPLVLSTAVRNSTILGLDISNSALDLFVKNIAHNASIVKNPDLNNTIIPLHGNVLNCAYTTNKFPVSLFSKDLPSSNSSSSKSHITSKNNSSISRSNLHTENTALYESIEKTNSLNVASVDLITSNPPYISKELIQNPLHTDKSVRLFEPRLALEGNTEFYAAIFHHAMALNAKAVVCEVGSQAQIDFMKTLANGSNVGWDSISVNDSNGSPRVVALWKKDSEWGFLKHLGDSSIL